MELWFTVLSFVLLLGIAAAVHVVMYGRTAQGSIAWVVALVMLPYITLPLYLIFGSHRFWGYIHARRAGDTKLHGVINQIERAEADLVIESVSPSLSAVRDLVKLPLVRGNRVDLLIDGEAIFKALFKRIDAAKEYLLIQFFIIHDDEIGKEFSQRLREKAQSGVRVLLLYDPIGSISLPERYLDSLRQAGVEVASFNTTRGWTNSLRLNFRNHRKVVVVDGRYGLMGGLNVGDEYLGRSNRFGYWRDTFVELEGPIVKAMQLSFCEDWFWATDQLPDLDWRVESAKGGDEHLLLLPTGPADVLESCTLFFLQAINSANERLWIVSPYFVPDPQLMSALQLAGLRGVDVRILIPDKPDHWMVYLSSFSFYDAAASAGIRFYRYKKGFLHQKVMLVDNHLATVGTANFDNRSFRINFEITLMMVGETMAEKVTKMLERDFADSTQVDLGAYQRFPFWKRLLIRSARLMSPVQ
ncbi:MAG: cardiolipin synthase [Gammaproteobacteria bacterium]|nr:cardiolipin synthase [Gammaproteobacteria bacterium]